MDAKRMLVAFQKILVKKKQLLPVPTFRILNVKVADAVEAGL